jgi:P27 family predicted phage terminase small subunit|tara:strand:+ start:48 stop:533 length:486 start_codon:yes stop_codon:yes gene_type:complete
MGKRGPKGQPTALLKAKGTGNSTRMKEDQLTKLGDELQWVNNGFPTPPDYLNEGAKAVWMQQLSEAQKVQGYISYLDLKVFAEYCYVCSEMDFLKDHSTIRTVEDNNGVIRVNPLYVELNKLRIVFLRLSAEFGFTPASRKGVELQQSNEPKQKDKYVGGL